MCVVLNQEAIEAKAEYDGKQIIALEDAQRLTVHCIRNRNYRIRLESARQRRRLSIAPR
jgi:hypothetical protein